MRSTIRLVGGPRPGERVYDDDIAWPPDEEIEILDHEGCYRLIRCYEVYAGRVVSIDRVAEYEWQGPR